MNSDSNELFDNSGPATDARTPMSPTRPLYWSIRREVWENRSIYIAPLVVTGVVLFGSLINTFRLPGKMKTLATLDAAARHALLVKPYTMAPAPIMFATMLVALFYSLDALYGERRDRSILFWKSMPVSDRTTVLSKALIPLAVLPAIALVLSIFSVIVILLWSTIVLIGSGTNPAPLWGEVQFIEEPIVMFYGLAVHALWLAPIYAWLLLVSAWAKRTPILMAALPFVLLMIFERIAFNTTHVAAWLGYRWTGAMGAAFVVKGTRNHVPIIDHLWQLTPGRFLTTPGLWTGLIAATLFLVLATRLRRMREPI